MQSILLRHSAERRYNTIAEQLLVFTVLLLTTNETHLPTQQDPPPQGTRLPRTYGDQKRAQSYRGTPR
jgi:hypothetical protein